MAETDVIIPISVETAEATASLADLGKSVNNARKELKNAEQGSVEYDKAMKSLAVATDKLAVAEARYKNDLAAVNKAMREAKASASSQLSGLKELSSQAETSAASIGSIAASQQKAQEQSVSFRTQLRDMREEMSQMLIDGVKPTDRAFVELAERAGKLRDAMQDANTTITLFASDTRGFDQVIRLSQTVTAGFSGVASAAAAFGADTQKVNDALRKAAAAFLLIQNLQKISTNIQKQGTIENTLYLKAMDLLGISIGKKTAATVADTQANVANAAAMKSGAVAAGGMTQAMKILRGAIIGLGIGALIVGLGLLISNFDKIIGLFSNTKEKIAALRAETDKYNQSVRDVTREHDNQIERMRILGATDATIVEQMIENNATLTREAEARYTDLLNSLDGARKKVRTAIQEELDKLSTTISDYYERGVDLQNQHDRELLKESVDAEKVREAARKEAHENRLQAERERANELLSVQQEILAGLRKIDYDQFEQRRIAENEAHQARLLVLKANNQSIEDAERLHVAAMNQIDADQREFEENRQKTEFESDIARYNAEADTQFTALEDFNRRAVENEKARQAAEQKIDTERLKNKQATMSAIGALLTLGSTLAGEGTATAKALGYTQAVISTAAGAAQVLGDTTLPLFAKIAGMVSVLAAGATQITTIARTKIPSVAGASDPGLGGNPLTMPQPIAALSTPIVETHSNITSDEIDAVNQAQRVYVVESDISEVLGRVRVAENESSF